MTATTTSRPHGYARYQRDGCRCTICFRARKAYDYRRGTAIDAGAWTVWAPAQPIREHLLKLNAAGFGVRRIQELSGVNREAIASLLGRRDRPSTKVRTETAKALLAVPIEAGPADGALVDATGSKRRIQALCCLGWTMRSQDAETGLARGTCQQIATGHKRVTVKNARLIATMYDRLSMTVAPDGTTARRAKRVASSHGWAPPLAWNDEDIDDPAKLAAGPRNGREQLRRWLGGYLALAAKGLTRQEIADRLGTKPELIKDRLRRARRNGLLDEMTNNEPHGVTA